MQFSVFHPPLEKRQQVPVLFYLAGLTCTEETFMIKAGAQRCAAYYGIMLVAPDASPRNPGIAGADQDWDFGDSMGGHGALMLALRHPELFHSVSAFAPVASPMRCPWGQKAFANYLGDNPALWSEHDASELMKKRQTPFPQGILIDQGLSDKFLHDQLMPHEFEQACRAADQPLTLRRQPGYDHSYYFVASYLGDHLAFHHENLGG